MTLNEMSNQATVELPLIKVSKLSDDTNSFTGMREPILIGFIKNSYKYWEYGNTGRLVVNEEFIRAFENKFGVEWKPSNEAEPIAWEQYSNHKKKVENQMLKAEREYNKFEF